jgi:TolB-like protein
MKPEHAVNRQDFFRALRFIPAALIFFAAGETMIQPAFAQEKWYKLYAAGAAAMTRSEWQTAITRFSGALEQRKFDAGKTRAAGAMFIDYYPNREIGVCYYHLGNLERARQFLRLSMQQSPSPRAREFLERIDGGEPGPTPKMSEPVPEPPKSVDNAPTTLVGDRLSIAILPFVANNLGGELAEVNLLDKLTTVFVNLNRFKVIERAQLEKILEEQKLGLSGVIDVSTAAQIGKGIGVDAVVCGSVVRAGTSATIDARLVDTESAAIVTAKDAFTKNLSLAALNEMIAVVAAKIKNDMPLISGYVIKVEGNRLTLDLGSAHNVRKGMKCHVYREGEPIVHPVTNQVIGKAIVEVCEAQLLEVFESYAIATVVKAKNGAPQVRDRVITK